MVGYLHAQTLLHPKFTLQKLDFIHKNSVVADIVDELEAYMHSSARNYVGRTDVQLPVVLIDFWVTEGYVAI